MLDEKLYHTGKMIARTKNADEFLFELKKDGDFVLYLGEEKKEDAYKIKRLDFNDNLKLIDFGAFYNCKDLESITFNSSPIIDNYSFNGCTNVKKIIISDKVLSRKLQINISDDYELSSISSKIYENTLFTIEEISKDKKFKHIIKVGKKYIDNEIVELNNNLNNTKKLTKKPIK